VDLNLHKGVVMVLPTYMADKLTKYYAQTGQQELLRQQQISNANAYSHIRSGNIDLSGLNIQDLNACKKTLDMISDPAEKFKAFDQLTDRALTSTSFTVLKELATDPDFSVSATKPYMTLGPIGPKYISNILDTIANCKELSETMMKSLEPTGKYQLRSICSQIDTYIDNKIFKVLNRIILSKNFANSAETNHPLHALYNEMWKLQAYIHGKQCPCYDHIQSRLQNG